MWLFLSRNELKKQFILIVFQNKQVFQLPYDMSTQIKEELITMHGEPVTVTFEKPGGFPDIEGMVMSKMMTHATTLRFGDAWKNTTDDMHDKAGYKYLMIQGMVYEFAPHN